MGWLSRGGLAPGDVCGMEAVGERRRNVCDAGASR
jgi:hypothetical protein